MARFNDLWLPGIVTGVAFMLAGAGLGWWISRSDTQAEITGISQANAQLQMENGALRQQEGTLETQAEMTRRSAQAQINGISKANMQLQAENGALHQQKGMLQMQVEMLTSQKAALDKLLEGVAQTDHDVKLIFDAQGHVLGAQVITDSNGRAILDSSGHPIMTERPQNR